MHIPCRLLTSRGCSMQVLSALNARAGSIKDQSEEVNPARLWDGEHGEKSNTEWGEKGKWRNG